MADATPPTDPPLRLYKGQTRHVRYMPFERGFAYRLFLIDLDIDRLYEADRCSGLFGVDRGALFSFRRRDHGYRKDQPLRGWAEDMFASADIALDGGAIRLITLPRHLFYKFAPISLWFGYGPGGDLRGVIYEVNNTFGHTHAYVAPVDGRRVQHEADKRLHVSPFFDVTGKYRFTLRAPDAHLSVIIENIVDNKRTHMASLMAKKSTATSGALLKAAVLRPLSTLGVTLAIHYEAFKLWVRKAGYRAVPHAPDETMSTATPRVQTDNEDRKSLIS